MTDPFDHLDDPRPLPPALRARLEDTLLATSARPLDRDATAELADALALQELLADLETPRPVPAAVRARFATTRSPARRWAPALVATAAAVTAGAVLVLPGGAERTPAARAGAPTSPPGAFLYRTDTPSHQAALGSFSGLEDRTAASGSSTKSVLRLSAAHLIRLAPASGDVDGGTWVTLTGYGFRPSAVVTFGGVRAARVQVRSSTVLRALSPRHLSGPVDVQVDGSNGLTFLYL